MSCGSLNVEIFMSDGSAFDQNIFVQEEQTFSVPYTEETSLQGLYELKLKAYYDE